MWSSMLSLALTLLICSTVMPPSTARSDEEIRRVYMDKFQKATNQSGSEAVPPLERTYSDPPREFSCDTTKPEWYTPATDVHFLTPWDISIVGAMGDSVTAAFGAASSFIIDTTEYRWLSWSIGGDKTINEVSTLPNIIKAYNPDLRGYSIDKDHPELNVAVTGAVASDMELEAFTLVDKMENDYDDVDDQWKVITLWIGGNDLCAVCDGNPEDHAVAYASRVEQSLRYLSNNVRRAYVNLVDMIDITQLMQLEGFWCTIIHNAVCPCATDRDNQPRIVETVRLYNEYLRYMLEANNYFDREDFTVVIQPFFSDTLVPLDKDGKADKSYFAPDCFHFSTTGHGIGALYLWNNMLEKLGEKTDFINWDNIQEYKCISDEFPYFSTDLFSSNLKKTNKHPDTSDTHLVPGLVGVACGILVVAIIAIIIIVVLYKRKKPSRTDIEQVKLITVRI